MTERLTVDQINSDQLDALYARAETADSVTAQAKQLLTRRTETLRTRAEKAEAANERVRNLHWAVQYDTQILCAECSAYDGNDSCDNNHVLHADCPTIAALTDPKEPTT
jgi:hypothetical protein